MKQDKAHITVQLFDDKKQVLVFHAVLEENGFVEYTQEYYYNKAVKLTLQKIERDTVHDYEKERFPELVEKEQ